MFVTGVSGSFCIFDLRSDYRKKNVGTQIETILFAHCVKVSVRSRLFHREKASANFGVSNNLLYVSNAVTITNLNTYLTRAMYVHDKTPRHFLGFNNSQHS